MKKAIVNSVRSERIFLSAEWRYLAMLNYEVNPELLTNLAPRGTELDHFEGRVVLSLVGFRFLNTRVLGIPVPFHSNFDEVNLRFYVCRQVGDEVRRGVVFVREIVPRWAIAMVARGFYNEQYVALPMRHEISANGGTIAVNYQWRSAGMWASLRMEVAGEPQLIRDGSEEQFITEHYWGYSAQRDGSTVEYQVTHPSWRVWQAERTGFSGDVEGLYGRDFAGVLRKPPSSAFLAEGSPITVLRGRRFVTPG